MFRNIIVGIFCLQVCSSLMGEDVLSTLKAKLWKELDIIGYSNFSAKDKSAIDAVILGTYRIGLEFTQAEKPREIEIPVEPYNVIFSTGVDKDNRPTNDLKTISFEDKKLFVFVKWNMPIGTHDYQCSIFDAVGKEVHRSRAILATTQIPWETWTWYIINPALDAPGIWKFEISMDGQKYVDRDFPVQQ